MRVYSQRPTQTRRHASGPPSPHTKAPTWFQPKLTIGTPGDLYEREADRVAEQLMRAPGLQVQRACGCGVSSHERGDEETLLQTKSARTSEASEAAAAPAVAEVLRSEGEPLAPAARDFFAPRFGHDFSKVRVHTNEGAAASARSLNALAYTVGSHVVFGAGQYAPGTSDGRRLLAHELTHVLQQSGRPSLVQRQTPPEEPEKKPEEQPKEALQFTYDAGLDPELKARFNRMVIALNAKGVSYTSFGDMRPRPLAHLLSTAYHIHTRNAVPLSDLKALKDGKDEDGNVWYQTAWESTSTWRDWGNPRQATDEEIMEQARENAFAIAQNQGSSYVNIPWGGGSTINCAYEGYETSDSHRKPNVAAVPISSHVVGKAVDLKGIDWDKLGGHWSDAANAFVASFGLTRPYVPGGSTYCVEEPWHFELATQGPKPLPPVTEPMRPTE